MSVEPGKGRFAIELFLYGRRLDFWLSIHFENRSTKH